MLKAWELAQILESIPSDSNVLLMYEEMGTVVTTPVAGIEYDSTLKELYIKDKWT